MKNFYVFIIFVLSFPLTAYALGAPKGDVILTISGNISVHNVGSKAEFDAEMLRKLPQHSISTETPWTDGERTFSGPLLRDVLSLVGAKGEKLQMGAINDYSITVPVGDSRQFDTILAMSLDGDLLTIRLKGPLWLIYPWSKFDSLRTETYYSRSIWQLKSIRVQ